MENRFVNIINYLEILKSELCEEIGENIDERILTIIKHAILTDKFYHGSIILTKENDKYIVSNIQKHSYAWPIQGKQINIEKICQSLDEMEIAYLLEPYQISDHLNDYELSFGIPKLNNVKRRTRE